MRIPAPDRNAHLHCQLHDFDLEPLRLSCLHPDPLLTLGGSPPMLFEAGLQLIDLQLLARDLLCGAYQVLNHLRVGADNLLELGG